MGRMGAHPATGAPGLSVASRGAFLLQHCVGTRYSIHIGPTIWAIASALVFRALWNRRLPRTRVEEGAIHVSGHSPLARVRRRDGVGVVQCDTGAGFGRRLSAVCVETGRVLSVPVS